MYGSTCHALVEVFAARLNATAVENRQVNIGVRRMRICLIAPYSGAWPVWTPLFLRSVELNSHLDRLFLISTTPAGRLPANVTQISMSLSEIEGRVRRFIHPDLSVPHAYKLCDLRPFYALLFPELVQGYDFWGYCDIDLVFGNMDDLLTPKRLAETDVFFADAHMVMGHFALYRNNPEINILGKRIPDYLKRLAALDHTYMDELGMSQVMAANPTIRWRMSRNLRESQLTLTHRGQMMGSTDGVSGERHRTYWRSGHTFIESREFGPQEVLYLHFMGLKRSYHWVAYDPAKTYDEFLFSGAGFVPWISPPNQMEWLKTAVRAGTFQALSSARGKFARAIPNEFRLRTKELLRRGCSNGD